MTAAFAQRAAAHERQRDAARRQSTRISRLRLAAVLPGVVCLLAGLSRDAHPLLLVSGIVLLIVFAVLVVIHSRVEERVEWHDALRTVCVRSVARIERRWDDLPSGDAPAGVDVTHHPFAIDLDLFGRASLFQWLGPGATALGRATMARWLLAPADGDEIAARQAAVAELAAPPEWREEFAAHGVVSGAARQAEVDRLFAWAEGRGPERGRRRVLQASAIAIVTSQWLLFVFWWTGAIAAALWLIPLLAGIVLSFVTADHVQHEFDRAGSGQRALSRFAALLEQATGRAFTSDRLRRVHEQLDAHDASAPRSMRRLNRILGFSELRRGAAILHFPVQAATLWDFWVLFALDRWRQRAGAHVRRWLEALGELDALALLAAIRHENPEWAPPKIGDEPIFTAERLGHPLIAGDRRVPNDVSVGPPGTLLLVTGSNMSGKSTLLRAIGLNAVLAQAGGCVCAARLRMPVVNLQTSIRVQDSLELGLSYFMAALARLKAVVDAAERNDRSRVLLYLLDEILQGTNSVERGIAVRAVARHLLDAGAIGAMTTHDLTLAGEEPLQSSAQLVHFTESLDASGSMSFDYRLRPGLATSRNALRLMQLIGITPAP